MTGVFIVILSAAIGTGVAISVGVLVMMAALYLDHYPSFSDDD